MQKIKPKVKIKIAKALLNRTQEKKFTRRCNHIKKLIEETEKSLWRIGDMILEVRSWYIDLLCNKGRTPAKARKEAKKVLASKLGITTQRVGQYADTADFFTPETRVFEASFFTHEQARKINKTVPLNRRCSAQEITQAMRNSKISTREITAWIKDCQARKIARNSRRRAVRWQPKMRGLVNFPHNCEWEDLIRKIPDGAINGVVWADPPWGIFKRDCTCPITYSGTDMTQGDNMSEDDAIQTTLRLFDLLPAKLASGVPLFLMQSGSSIDNPRIIVKGGAKS